METAPSDRVVLAAFDGAEESNAAANPMHLPLQLIGFDSNKATRERLCIGYEFHSDLKAIKEKDKRDLTESGNHSR